MRTTKQDLIDLIIAAHYEWSDKLDAGYDEEAEEIDRDYLETLTPCTLTDELKLAELGTQFDE